jgi:hypothetical protein
MNCTHHVQAYENDVNLIDNDIRQKENIDVTNTCKSFSLY